MARGSLGSGVVMKRWHGMAVALTFLGTASCAANEAADAVPPPPDSGKPDTVVLPPPDARDTGTGPDRTVGKVCTTNKDCDLSGAALNYCSNSLFAAGTVLPTPVCFGKTCEIPDPTKVSTCDGDVGLCVSVGTSNLCFPRCDFDDTGASPTGCAGKDTCTLYGWSKETTTKGIGFCLGGCRADADCTGGDKCQVEDGFCLKSLHAYSKKLGDACTKDGDGGTKPNCNCLYDSKGGLGFCTQVCRMGDKGGCPAGFTCDGGLPKKDAASGEVLFTTAPMGLQGNCSKNCTVDGDCEAYGGYCEEMAGTGGQKTCQIGTRP